MNMNTFDTTGAFSLVPCLSPERLANMLERRPFTVRHSSDRDHGPGPLTGCVNYVHNKDKQFVNLPTVGPVAQLASLL